MSSRNRKPLTNEELLQLLDNDNDSDLPVLSDDDMGWDESSDKQDEDLNTLLEFMDSTEIVYSSDEECEGKDNMDNQKIRKVEKENRENNIIQSKNQEESNRKEREVGIIQKEKYSQEKNKEAKRKIKEDKISNMKFFYEMYNLTEKENIHWMDNVYYETRNIKWHCQPLLPIVDLPSPIDFFRRYIPDHIFEKMRDMTNLYTIQKNIN